MRELTIFKDDGAEQVIGASLVAGTYYAEFTPEDSERCRVNGFHWIWDATVAATVTVEGTNIPSISAYAAASSGWDPQTATVPTIAGGSAGNDLQTLTNTGAGRLRTKLVVTTGGVLRVYENHKH